MKNIGKILKEARISKRYSLKKIETATKIKKEFIEAIESGNWQNLPEFPVVAGFVKNLASYLEIDRKKALALLKRDYPPKVLLINPKPDMESKFIWTPRRTFWAGIVIVLMMIVGYLGFEYLRFTTPPILEISQPKEGYVATLRQLTVSGKTDPDATVKINNQPVLVKDDGSFTAQIEIFEGTKEIKIIARARSGKETVISRKSIPELK